MAEQKVDASVQALIENLPGAIAEATLKVQNELRPIEKPATKTSVFNPSGKARPKLTRKVMFCGHQEDVRSLTNEEIELYNQLRPGRYNNKTWKVEEFEHGDNDVELRISLPVSDPDMRMSLPNSLGAILRQMIAEGEKNKAAAAARQ